MAKKAITYRGCAGCNRIVQTDHVDEDGYCVFCQEERAAAQKTPSKRTGDAANSE